MSCIKCSTEAWPAMSPHHLSLQDYFMWGHMMSFVTQNSSQRRGS